MKHYLLTVVLLDAGSEENFKFTANNDREANALAAEKTEEVYANYGIDPDEYAEENGCELEYDYGLEDVARITYLKSEYEEIN